MKLANGWHLAYCTNIHRGESWAQTFQTLRDFTLRVRDNVCPKDQPYAIGLRLGATAALELSQPETLDNFQHWLEANNCYVFTINGFPYGTFHGARVKEDVYRPDWTTRERVDYTKLLFRLLARLCPADSGGSVSTVPCSYKEFIQNEKQVQLMKDNLWEMVDFLDELSRESGKDLHLGLEPEPLCYLETSTEMVNFINAMREDRPGDQRINQFLGVNYDTCHLAIEFENPVDVLKRFTDNHIRISKIHLSSALKLKPTPERLEALRAFDDPVYFHQVIINRPGLDNLIRIRDLNDALDLASKKPVSPDEEWRIHFHIPLHSPTNELFTSTSDHISGLLDALTGARQACRHFEMETYTWEVLPDSIKSRDVVDQLTLEYQWTLDQLKQRGFSQ